jgi:hypothetical protein
LVFVVLFIVETRGRTLEETAALFDDEGKPESLAQREPAVIAIRPMSTPDVEPDDDDDDDDNDNDDFLYSGKAPGLESYELRRPQVVLERDRVGHRRGNIVLSFDKRI